MAQPEHPTTEQLAQQIEAFRKELPHYRAYADALKHVLEQACRYSVPDAIVQTRAKDARSFAEKFVRKFARYPDAARQMTDLCGGRVIVQTLQQVKAVRLFVEQNFVVLECDDKGLLLGEGRFGYRDIHYLVRLRPDRARLIGFSDEPIEAIGGRIAELQVRSWVQHAWADTLHDRMYKAPLRLSGEAKRTGALLAAIMEDGDRAFDRLAMEIDGMVANYTAYHGRRQVQEEIAIQELILGSETSEQKRPRVALALAWLLGPLGEYARVVEILWPYANNCDAMRYPILLELGHALCKVHRERPTSEEYRRGQGCLQEVIDHCTCGEYVAVPDLCRQKSMHAKALTRLAESWAVVPDGEGQARQAYREALEVEPTNPYLLASQLGFEIFCLRTDAMIDSMRTTIRQGIETCRQHAVAGTELPLAWFTGGRLSLLLGEVDEAIGWYARGLRHVFDPEACAAADMLGEEIRWIRRIHMGAIHPPKEHKWIERLISLAEKVHQAGAVASDARRALVLAGWAEKMEGSVLQQARPLVRAALEVFEGIVISGGTAAGVPGCAGEVAAQLQREGRKRFEFVGYRPALLHSDVPRDDRYDRAVAFDCGPDFSAELILRMWEDLIKAGMRPEQVRVLGLGGGRVTAVEYYVALALGATVGVVQLPRPDVAARGMGSAGIEAQSILVNPLWAGTASLYPLPYDAASVRAFVNSAAEPFEPGKVEEMAVAFHERYVDQSTSKLPENLRPWSELSETYRRANLEQARYTVAILMAAGFEVCVARGTPATSIWFTKAEIETMAELEHGRWNVERLRDGWRPGQSRDNEKRLHDCLVPWAGLPEAAKACDRDCVWAFPEVLAKAGLEIRRR